MSTEVNTPAFSGRCNDRVRLTVEHQETTINITQPYTLHSHNVTCQTSLKHIDKCKITWQNSSTITKYQLTLILDHHGAVLQTPPKFKKMVKRCSTRKSYDVHSPLDFGIYAT